MSETPAPNTGETITPQEAWTKLCGMYLIAARDQLKHSVVCPKHEITLEFKENKRGQNKFRIACHCGAQHEIPTLPDWHGAWDLITKTKPLIIVE